MTHTDAKRRRRRRNRSAQHDSKRAKYVRPGSARVKCGRASHRANNHVSNGVLKRIAHILALVTTQHVVSADRRLPILTLLILTSLLTLEQTCTRYCRLQLLN